MANDGGIPRAVIHPDEVRVGIGFRYPANKLPAGFTISSGVATAENLRTGSDTTASVLDSGTVTVTSPDANGQQTATVNVTGGGSTFNDTQHKIKMVLTLSDGGNTKVFVDVFILKVTDRVTEG